MKPTHDLLKTLDSPLFKKMDASQIEAILANSEVIGYKKNEFIYHKGDITKFVYFVVKGSVKLGVTIDKDRTIIKEIMYDRDIFGENIFVQDLARKEFAKCFADAYVLRIDVRTIRQIIIHNVECAEFVTQIIIQRLNHLQKRMQAFTQDSAKERIIDFIKSIARKRGLNIGINECLINHGMSHKEIAFLTDTSRQTVARILGDLKKSNFIHFGSRKPGKILIRDRAWALGA